MGRSTNSFLSYVGHAEETIDDSRISLPEKELWVAVLCRAILDAVKGPPHLDMTLKANRSHKNHYAYDRDQARHFFMEGGPYFRHVCRFAGRDPDYVQEKIKKILLRKNGWNVDVPITSHYRSRKRDSKRGPYKKKKKHLTGNAYYAAKAKKNFYYQDMGRKGGRPRIYNKIEGAQ
tara:strand:+ start:209 stop:736 length:528 start_codon:yes stop_codon:yes gene_type:complete